MKFLLDTNVLSAMMTGGGTPEVAAWIAIRSTESLFTASICEAEILAGLAIMPDGRRRSALESSAHAMFAEDFRGRVWAFDDEAARSYAAIFAARRRTGRPIATMDLMIAAIARTRDAVIVHAQRNGFPRLWADDREPLVDLTLIDGPFSLLGNAPMIRRFGGSTLPNPY